MPRSVKPGSGLDAHRPRMLLTVIDTDDDGTAVTLADRIVAGCATGAYFTDACRNAHVVVETGYTWLARGRAALRMDPIPDAELDFADFARRIDHARGARFVQLSEKLTDLTDSDDHNVALRAVTFALERGDPANWGRSTRPEIGEAPDEEARIQREREQQGQRFYAALRAILVELDIDIRDPKTVEVIRRHLLAAAIDDERNDTSDGVTLGD